MHDLTIGIEFLTGRYVAASVSDRDEPEWPSHPGRVFMAMAAACFETGELAEDVAALEWLEVLPEPEIIASEAHARSTVKFYVPVNDKLTAKGAMLQTTPGLTRSKQERSYPTTIPVDSEMRLVWRDVPTDAKQHVPALARVCGNVIRVGHSSSLVRMWATLDDHDSAVAAESRCRWIPAGREAQLRVRIAVAGELARLRAACNAERIHQFGDLKSLIESTKGKEKAEAKRAFGAVFGQPFKGNLRPPEPTPPTLGMWAGYRRAGDAGPAVALQGNHFGSELLILAHSPLDDEPRFGIGDCLALTSRLRETFMSQCSVNPIPEWLSGHQLDTGEPTEMPHVAFLALPFAGHKYADGHVLGLALALPRPGLVTPEECGHVLGPMLFDEEANARPITLKLGRLGQWTVAVEERAQPPQSLQNDAWTRPSHAWASVTPVVLDRFPKSQRTGKRTEWESEVRSIVVRSCMNAGLPHPVEVDIDSTSWHRGVPRAYSKTRRARGDNEAAVRLGDGFPTMAHRRGKPTRPQIHVWLRFDERVQGPVVLGAGRFLGYGLCKPIAST